MASEGGTTDLTTQETDMPFITHSTRPPAGTALRRRKVDEENGKGTAPHLLHSSPSALRLRRGPAGKAKGDGGDVRREG